MTTPQHRNDQVVEDYLRMVDDALVGLPAAYRTELLADLREHIATERSALDVESEGQVRTILDRLGDPETVAAAARADVPVPTAPTRVAPTTPTQAPSAGPAFAPPRPPGRRGPLVWVAISVAVLFVVLFVGCLLGGLLLFSSGPSVGDPAHQPVAPTSTSPAPSFS